MSNASDSGRPFDLARMPDPAWLHELAPEGTRLDLADAEHAGAADDWIRERYRAPRADWVRMNMLGSLNGRVTGPDGTSDSLSNRADRRILRLIREMSDVVVVGANTVREERHTSTRPTWLCVITTSGDLTGHRIRPDDAAHSVLVCGPASARERALETMPGANFVEFELDDGGVALPEVLGHLRERGLRQIVVEGGKALISQFLDEGLLDEVCITQAPYFGPDAAPALPASTRETRFRREPLLADEYGYLYQRLVADGA
jgi:riboflavin biosynthesis pyrimidine reductase